MDEEIWKDIEGYEDYYQVSNMGRVKGLSRIIECKNGFRQLKERILTFMKDRDGYLKLSLSKDGISKQYIVHRLVAEAFILNPKKLPQVNHKNEFEKWNNTVENLEWVTEKENINYGTGLKRRADKRSKRVYQYSKDYELIKVWKSATDTKKNGYNAKHVSACCNLKRKTHKNFIWSFELINTDERKII